jgi:cell division septal protein FtsQ
MKGGLSFLICAFFAGAILIYAAARFVVSDVPPQRLAIYSDTGKIDEEVRLFLEKNAKTPGKIPEELPVRFPNIEHVSIKNHQNGTAEVRIKYKKIVGVWERDGAYYPLLENGTHINAALPKRPGRGIVFRGVLPDNVGDIILILSGYPDLVKKTDYMEHVEGRRWNITLNGGAVVMLPELNAAAAVGRMKKTGILGKSFRVLDLRDPHRVLVK